jgi:hypothetical protein
LSTLSKTKTWQEKPLECPGSRARNLTREYIRKRFKRFQQVKKQKRGKMRRQTTADKTALDREKTEARKWMKKNRNKLEPLIQVTAGPAIKRAKLTQLQDQRRRRRKKR